SPGRPGRRNPLSGISLGVARAACLPVFTLSRADKLPVPPKQFGLIPVSSVAIPRRLTQGCSPAGTDAGRSPRDSGEDGHAAGTARGVGSARIRRAWSRVVYRVDWLQGRRQAAAGEVRTEH